MFQKSVCCRWVSDDMSGTLLLDLKTFDINLPSAFVLDSKI